MVTPDQSPFIIPRIQSPWKTSAKNSTMLSWLGEQLPVDGTRFVEAKKNIQLASWSSICVYIYYIRVHSYSFIFLVLNHSESTFYRYQWIPFVFRPFFRFNHQPQTLHPNRAFCGRWGLFSPPTPRGRLHASALGNIIDIIMDLLHQ
jgi:hypothetical protein